MQKITLRINKKTGEMETSVSGVKGGHCVELLKKIKEQGDIINEEYTNEFYEYAQEYEDVDLSNGYCG